MKFANDLIKKSSYTDLRHHQKEVLKKFEANSHKSIGSIELPTWFLQIKSNK